METKKSEQEIRLEIHEIAMVKGTLTLSSNLMIVILTRIHAGYFRISLSLGWQALLWKILLQPSQSSPIIFRVPKLYYSTILTILWAFSLFTLLLLSLLYALRCILRFNLVKAEFMHHVGVNYFFAPWISWILILESAPFVTPKHVYFVILWWLFVVPIVILDLKIYGQWFTKGKNFLTAVANPTSQLSVIGNLVGARAAAKMGWRETSTFLFSLGMVHYLVLFVTLYQRLSGGDQLPAMLRPVFFLFFAAPSVASLAWYSIAGRFDTAAKMLFYLSLFLFASLIAYRYFQETVTNTLTSLTIFGATYFKPALFKKAMRRFNVAWWAYSYPITILALTSARYEEEVKSGVSHAIRVALCILSVLVLFGLLTFNLINPRLLLPPEDDPILVNNLPTLPSQELS